MPSGTVKYPHKGSLIVFYGLSILYGKLGMYSFQCAIPLSKNDRGWSKNAERGWPHQKIKTQKIGNLGNHGDSHNGSGCIRKLVEFLISFAAKRRKNDGSSRSSESSLRLAERSVCPTHMQSEVLFFCSKQN